MTGEVFNIRKTRGNELSRLLEIYAHAREMMKQTGNPNQWITYPPSELVKADIENGISYAVEIEGEICGTFVFFIGNDPTYNVIDGEWLNDEKYGVIHRIASDGTHKGVLEAAVNYCFGKIQNLRMDTYKDNKIMQYLLEKNGFRKCGIISVGDDTDFDPLRIAYQKI